MNPSQWKTPAVRHSEPGLLPCVLIAAFVFAVGLRLGIGTAGTDLDQSWSAVIAWAHVHGARWGQDIAFTYGPLGWLNCYATYNREIFGVFIAGQVLMTLATALVFGLAIGAAPRGRRLLPALVLLAVAPWLQADVLMLGTLILVVVALDRIALMRSEGAGWLLATLAIATLTAALGLLKFSLFPICVTAWGSAGILLLQRRKRRLATAWLAGVPIAALLLWLGNGQHLADLGPYLTVSFRMAADYGHSMGTPGSLSLLLLGVVALAFTGLLLFVWWLSSRGERLRATALLCHLALCLYLGWRASFTRADPAHVGFFLPLCSLILMALVVCTPQSMTTRLARFFSLGLVVPIGLAVFMHGPAGLLERFQTAVLHSRTTLASLVDLNGLRAEREADRSRIAAALDLPRTRALVGNASVDLLTSAQGLLLANQLNYAPRPVFQSYAAFSPQLLRLNEAHFLGSNAPAFVLLKLDPIDQRYPTSEDSLALLALLRRYEPVEMERGFVVLRRREGSSPAAIPDTAPDYVEASLGDWIDVPAGAAILMHAEIGQSLLGRVYSTALREPETLLEVALSNGESRQFRLLRGVARSGFLLSPFLADEEDYLGWYFGEERPRVQRLRLVAPVTWQAALQQPRFRIGFTPVELPRASTPMPAALAAALFPGFDLAPVGQTGNTSTIEEDGKFAIFMHALATLDFAPAPGSYSLQLTYGVRSEAFTSPACVQGDGIRLKIERAGGPAAVTLYQRDINPFANEAERGPQQASVGALSLGPEELLRVTVDTGPAGSNGGCDWGYVRDLRLQAIPASAQ